MTADLRRRVFIKLGRPRLKHEERGGTLDCPPAAVWEAILDDLEHEIDVGILDKTYGRRILVHVRKLYREDRELERRAIRTD